MATDLKQQAAGLTEIASDIGRPVRIMEVCGTHTVSIFRHGIRAMLPKNLRLISGPGCPVCVTAQRHIDAAVQLSTRAGVIVATYGDMVRVPGYQSSLERRRALGADVRVIHSARSAVALAEANPDKQVVFIAVGFETTAPATAVAIRDAQRRGLGNFSILPAHKLVVPAMLALLRGGDVPLHGFICPGHVSVTIGANAYQPIVDRYRVPCVVTGFEPRGILEGLTSLLRQIRDGEARVENRYAAAVTADGNPTAMRLMHEVFEVADAPWRSLGVIPRSGLDLRPAFRRFDALLRFGLSLGQDVDHPACRCGEVIQGKLAPDACTLFANGCSPMHPIGPCMVSSEGTCSAWHKYNRAATPSPHSKVGGGAW